MVLVVPLLARCVDALQTQGPMRLLITSPQGRRLDQTMGPRAVTRRAFSYRMRPL